MDLKPPLYPPDTRAKGYRLELDYERINQSDTWALASSEQRPLLLMCWFVAWQQTPCGTFPDDDLLIAARIGIDLTNFEKHRSVLLRGWRKHSDGRLYHPVITELVLEKIARRDREAQRKAAYRERMKPYADPHLSHGTDGGQTRGSCGNDNTGTGTGTGTRVPLPSHEVEGVVTESVRSGFAAQIIGNPEQGGNDAF